MTSGRHHGHDRTLSLKRMINIPFSIIVSWRCCFLCIFFFFFNDTATTEIYTLSLHDALPILTNLSTECLIQLTKLGYDATPFNQILKQNAKREMRLRLGKVTVADVLAAQPVTTNLLKFMRASIKMIGVSNLQSFIASMTQ